MTRLQQYYVRAQRAVDEFDQDDMDALDAMSGRFSEQEVLRVLGVSLATDQED